MPVLPPRPKRESALNTGLRLPQSVMARLDEIAEAHGQSRNAVITHFLRCAIEIYEEEMEERAAAEEVTDPDAEQVPPGDDG